MNNKGNFIEIRLLDNVVTARQRGYMTTLCSTPERRWLRMCCWQSQSDSEISAGINGCTVGQCKDLILKPVTLVRVAGVSRPQREIRVLPDRRCWSRAAASAAPSVRSAVQASALRPLDLSEAAAAGRAVGRQEPAPAAPDRLCARSPANSCVLSTERLPFACSGEAAHCAMSSRICSAHAIVADVRAAGHSAAAATASVGRRSGGRRRRRRRAPVLSVSASLQDSLVRVTGHG